METAFSLPNNEASDHVTLLRRYHFAERSRLFVIFMSIIIIALTWLVSQNHSLLLGTFSLTELGFTTSTTATNATVAVKKESGGIEASSPSEFETSSYSLSSSSSPPPTPRPSSSSVVAMNHTNNSNKTGHSSNYDRYHEQYPYVPYKFLLDCGLTDNNNNDSLIEPKLMTNISLAFIKTHKTGSSTVSNLVNRWIDYRNMTKMIPMYYVNLDWPKTFTGKSRDDISNNNDHDHDLDTNATIVHKYDAIANHAIFNYTTFNKHLKEEKPFVFTVLREPISRLVSAQYYFEETRHQNWSVIIQMLKNFDVHPDWNRARFLNSMATDLGWYEYLLKRFGEPTKEMISNFDRNSTIINQFITDVIDPQIDFVMILERMEESLLLLREKLTTTTLQQQQQQQQQPVLAITELIYGKLKDNTKKIMFQNDDGKLNETKLLEEEKKKQRVPPPTELERKQLSELLFVDTMIYDHFNSRTKHEWNVLESTKPKHYMELIQSGLNCLQTKITDTMQMMETNNIDDDTNKNDNIDVVLPDKLKDILTTDSFEYTKYLEQKQYKQRTNQND